MKDSGKNLDAYALAIRTHSDDVVQAVLGA